MSNGQMTLVNAKFLSRIAILGFCFFVGLLGASQTALATDSTLTITLSENAVTANVAPFATSSGTFTQSSGMTVGVSTNHISGYTLSISASDTTTPGRLKNGSSYLQSIATPTTLNDFKNADLSSSDLATSLGLSDCTEITESSNCKGIWGYKPNYLYDTTMDATNANDLFLPTPGTAGQIIAKTSGPNATANEYTITLGAKVSPLASVGSYTNTFVLMAVGNNIPYVMEFSENTVQNMPVNILDGSTSGTTATIPSGTANTPTRPGYRFLGWCDQATTKSGDTDTCAIGHDYQPGDTLTLDATGANNVKLYAMWGPAPKTIATATTMQEVEECPASLTTEQVYTIKDSRDNQDYKVARLADGKCWMVENLNIAGGTALSADNTDVTSAYISSFSTSNNLTKTGDTIVLPASSTSGFSSNVYSYVYNSGNKTNCGASGQDTPCYSYYSWDAATLGSGRSISTDNTDAEHSICPKGWKLPTSRTTSASNWQSADFYALAHQYGLDGTTSTSESDNGFYTQAGPGTTPNFLLAGGYYRSLFSNGGSRGYYWSSTSYSNLANARDLIFYSSSIISANTYDRSSGYSVRCLFSGQ